MIFPVTPVLLAAAIVRPAAARVERYVAERDDAVAFFAEGVDIPPPTLYSGKDATKASPVLNGRSLLNSWLHPRALQCDDPAWSVCPSELGCCAQLSYCCSKTLYCKDQDSDICCPDFGTCQAGYECSSGCQCIEAGGECCSDGRYCSKGNICVISSEGQRGCCTDLSCTAYVSSGATVPLTPTAAPTTQALFIFYYYTITWSYYYYFYTIIGVQAASTLTSTWSTTYTTISVYESNSAAARSSFADLTATITFSTPAAATTALGESTALIPSTTPPPSFPSSSATSASTGNPDNPNNILPGLVGANVTGTSSTSSGQSATVPAGGQSRSPASRIRSGATLTESWLMIGMAAVALLPGVLMIWL